MNKKRFWKEERMSRKQEEWAENKNNEEKTRKIIKTYQQTSVYKEKNRKKIKKNVKEKLRKPRQN